jgi:hypothetical protein
MAGNYDVLFQMDADNPPIKSPWDLVEVDLDIIGLPTPIWRLSKDKPPILWNAFVRGKCEDETIPDGSAYKSIIPPQDGGLEEVDGIGGGALFIKRRVFENARMMREGWHRMWREDDGTAYRGLDLAFSQRAKEEGFRIFVAWDYPCNHFKEINLLEVEAGFKVWNQSRRKAGLLA